MLSALRRKRPQKSSPDGCAPAMFADQVTEYVEQARAGRAPDTVVPEPVVAEEPIVVHELLVAEEDSSPVWVLTPAPECEPAPAHADDDAQEIPLVLLEPVYDGAYEVVLPPEVIPVSADVPQTVVIEGPVAAAARAADTTRRRKTTPKTAVPKPAPKPAAAKPAQDEWGLFDPNQCGFAALLDKLDEVTAKEEGAGTNDQVSVRIISY
jgi:hypothetical protein